MNIQLEQTVLATVLKACGQANTISFSDFLINRFKDSLNDSLTGLTDATLSKGGILALLDASIKQTDDLGSFLRSVRDELGSKLEPPCPRPRRPRSSESAPKFEDEDSGLEEKFEGSIRPRQTGLKPISFGDN